MSPGRRLIALATGIAALAIVAAFLPLHAIPTAIGTLGPVAPVAGAVVGAALLVALVPRTPISVACGLLFGAGLGCVLALLAAMLAATVTFALGRWLGRDFLAARLGTGNGRLARAWQRLQRWVDREGTLAVAGVRSVPIAPYGLVGYAYGASGVRVRHYALGTLIAGAPSAVTYALLGAAIGGQGGITRLVFLPLLAGWLLIGIVLVRTIRHRSTVDRSR